jgi:hypothetical protein
MAAAVPDDRLRQALALLGAAARDRLRAAGGNGRRPDLELTLRLPLAEGELPAALEALDAELTGALREALAATALCSPGRVWCPRCASAECEHAAPADPRQVFAGWGASGLPRFLDLGQLLLEAQHPRVVELYDERPQLLTLVQGWRDLAGALLPAYRERFGGLRVHGQVVAGWYRAGAPAGPGHGRLAIAVQLLSSGEGRRRRHALHLLAGADAGLLEGLQDRHGRLPWADALRWAETTLEQIHASMRRPRAPAPAALEARLQGLLLHLAERLERPFQGRQRRTGHAQERHSSVRPENGGRPTRTALADLRAAPAERILFDPRHETYVVLGPHGRTHVFAGGGKLVTSLRYPAATIARRQKSGDWRAVAAEQAAAMRARVEALLAAAPGEYRQPDAGADVG